ncbi:MAG: hypothetical protein MHMPM18_003709 [Marteilia pararefringens]
MLMICPNNLIYMTTYEFFKQKFCQDQTIQNATDLQSRSSSISKTENMPQSFLFHSLAGTLARIFTVSCTSPIDLFRTVRMTSPSVKYKHIFKQINLLNSQKRIGAYYRGLIPTLCRDVPFSAIYWPLCEYLQNCLEKNQQINKMNGNGTRNWNGLANSFSAACISGALCTVITQPFDITKTYIQANTANNFMNNESVVSLMKRINSSRRNRPSGHILPGIRIFYTGLSFRLIKVPISCAILLTSFNFLQSKI